jgi:release factor glutamine methyltransferase
MSAGTREAPGDGRGAAGPTVAESVKQATARIRAAGSASPRLDAELLLAHVFDGRRELLYREPERRLQADQVTRYEELVARRVRREPVAYIVGHKPFRTIDVLAGPSAIVPRPDTETLVEVALDALSHLADPSPRVLDVGTGTGAVALALCAEHPGARVIATDIDGRTLELARRNAEMLHLADRIDFVQSDLFDDLPPGARFDVIVSNPPYVSEAELESLQPEIRVWEPRAALVSGPTGLEVYERLVPGALPFLDAHSLLAVEIHEGRVDEVCALFRDTGRFSGIAVHQDLGGAARVVSARERA